MTASQTISLQQARLIIHAPEAFSKAKVRAAVKFILASPDADDEDRFWADAASDI
jgi:hypothetical protein